MPLKCLWTFHPWLKKKRSFQLLICLFLSFLPDSFCLFILPPFYLITAMSFSNTPKSSLGKFEPSSILSFTKAFNVCQWTDFLPVALKPSFCHLHERANKENNKKTVFNSSFGLILYDKWIKESDIWMERERVFKAISSAMSGYTKTVSWICCFWTLVLAPARLPKV